MTLSWEIIVQDSPSESTQRLKVHGGWLVCRVNGIHIPQSMAMAFVADPEYKWQ